MNKKILMLIFCMLFLVGTISAFDFDNVISYENNDMKVKFKNCDFWLGVCLNEGEDLGTIELKSHSSVTEIKSFGFGKEEVVMYYDFTDWELYENGLGNVEFIDMRTGEEVDKDYYFVEWVLEQVEVNDYQEVCNDLGNGTNECYEEVSGTHLEERGSWVEYNNRDIPNRNVRIGLKTYVGRNDYIDGVWTIAGKKVKKHVTWTGSLSVGQVSYWKFDESSGNLADEQGNNTLTAESLSYSQTGATLNTVTSITYSAGASTSYKANPVGMNGDLSGTMWVKAVSRTNLDTFLGFTTASSDSINLFFRDPDLLELSGSDGAGETATGVYTSYMGSWTFIYWEITSTTLKLYVNNSLFAEDVSVDWSGITVNNFSVGTATNGGRDLRGGMDEVGVWNRALSDAERTFIWNSGLGCMFGEDTCVQTANPPEVTLNKPDNNTVFQTNTISMNCTVSDEVNLVNVSLILDGELNETLVGAGSSLAFGTDCKTVVFGILTDCDDNMFDTDFNTYGFYNYTGTTTRSETFLEESFNTTSIGNVNITAKWGLTNCGIGGCTVGYGLSCLNHSSGSYLTQLSSTSSTPNFNSNATSTLVLPEDCISDNVTIRHGAISMRGVSGGVSKTRLFDVNISNLYNFDKIVSPGDHNWTCRAANNISRVTTADTRFFNINFSVGTELISPIEGENFTESLVDFVVNSTPINQDLDSLDVTVWFSNNTLAFTNSTPLSGSVEVQTTVTPSLTDGNYIWGATTTGTATTNTTSNRTFTIHTTPSTVVILFPTGNIESFAVGDNLTLNWSITEPGQNLSEHIVNCSYTYNGTKTDLNQTQCIEINETSFLYVNGVNNLSFTVLEEFGLTTTNTTSWTFSLLELNQSFVNETIEGASNDFEINYSIGSGLVISAVVLWYEGTSSLSITSDFGGGILGAIVGGIVAKLVDADSNISFHWSFIFSDGSQINTTSRNQTVLDLSIDDCSVNTNLIYNYTIVDEETQLKINETSLELSINLFDLSREVSVLNFSKDYESTNPGLVCLNLSLTNDTSYSLDSTAKYSSNKSTGYAIEYYNLLNFTLNNITSEPDIILYDLSLDDSTDFQLTYRDENLAFDPDIRILVNRQYISEDVFKIVEIPITDSKGQTVLHLVRNDVVYNLIMTDIQGNIVATFNKVRAFCQDFTIGDCSLSLNADRGVDTVLDITSTVGITYGLSYVNSTSILSLEFVSNDLTPKKVSFQVIRNTDFGNRTVCLEDLTSSSGILTCNLTDVSERYLFLDILVDDEFIGTNTLDKGASSSGVYGTEGYFMAFLIILLLITMFSDQKQVLVFSLLIGWIAVISLSLISGGLFGIFSSGIWLVVTIALYLWKLRGETI